jgi:hypothetical protein
MLLRVVSSNSWLPAITRFLQSIPHSGLAGFEGLVARLCEAATSQRFRLSGSGSQSGQDARSEAGYGNCIKVEAKHYSKTELDTRELIAEIVQATERPSDVELWVLARSCRVRDQHAVELEAVARERDVEVLILDLGVDGLPRICVLMASFPDTVQDWILQNATPIDLGAVSDALARLATEPGLVGQRIKFLGN